ncbi:MAG: 50S ribosomal protein L29 [Candidatus Paceibacterota bacterium]|jgi:ribosomal protein L29
MAKKKENLKEVKTGELEKKLHTLQEEERGIRFKAEGARSKNVKELWNLKKTIARILTELNNRTGEEK